MDGPTALTNRSMRFICYPDAVKVTIGFIIGRLHLEQLSGVAATLHLNLLLPLKVGHLLLHCHAFNRSMPLPLPQSPLLNFYFALSTDVEIA